MTNCDVLEERLLTAQAKKSYPTALAECDSHLPVDNFMIEKFIFLSLIFGFSHHSNASSQQSGARVQAQSNQLVPDIGNKKGNRGWAQFDGQYFNYSNDYNTTSMISTRLTDAGEIMISVPEANINKNWNYFDFQAGRFLIPWAPIDRAWSLGYVNNRKNFTAYQPGEEGLTGVMGGVDFNSGFHIQSFASFLYIPELNPSQQVKDGQVTSKNIWASPVPKYADINGTLTPIKYYLNQPDLKSIIFRPTFGQMIGYNYSFMNISAYYLLKPENQVRAAGEAKLTTNGEVIANINAKLYYEEVYGSTLAFKHEDYKAYLSWMRIDPQNSPVNDPLFVQYIKIESQLEARNYGGFGASKKTQNYHIGFNWIALLTTPKGSQDMLANKSRFREALDVFFVFNFTERLRNNFDIKFDVMKQDKIIMEEIAYEFNRGIVLSTGVNIIDSPTDSSYWSKFRDNDAVYANMAYNF
jgi:hypothetical protein